MENHEIAWAIRDHVRVDRKPFDADEISSRTHVDEIPIEVFELMSKLPIIDGNEFDFDNEGFFQRGVVNGEQQCYIMEINDRTFFIDTQGYGYARYVGEIIK
jgi:hypothetical protein